MKTKISVRNLNLFYWDFQALHNINLEITKQKITAIIGPPGSGKSTFLRTVNRMHLQKGVRVEGEVMLDGVNIYSGDCDVAALRKRVGLVLSKPNLFPLSVYENVAFGPRVHGIKSRRQLDEIVESSLQKVGLWDELLRNLHRPCSLLSPGQQQRLCIARQLAVKPEVVLMDEPTLSLDPLVTRQVEELILVLQNYYTIIIVTQNSAQAARVSDYTAFFQNGRLVEFGATGDIFTRPVDPRTEDYITGRWD